MVQVIQDLERRFACFAWVVDKKHLDLERIMPRQLAHELITTFAVCRSLELWGFLSLSLAAGTSAMSGSSLHSCWSI